MRTPIQQICALRYRLVLFGWFKVSVLFVEVRTCFCGEPGAEVTWARTRNKKGKRRVCQDLARETVNRLFAYAQVEFVLFYFRLQRGLQIALNTVDTAQWHQNRQAIAAMTALPKAVGHPAWLLE